MMHKILLLLLTLLTNHTFATPQELSTLIRPLTDIASVSIVVLDTPTGNLIYAKNPDLYLMPASTQKILTAVAATHRLDNEAPFTTNMWIYGEVNNKVLHGDVVIKGTGDPSLTTQKLQQLISKLSEHTIQRIQGNIVLLDQHFDQRTHIPGTFWEEQNDCYCPQASALSLDDNCFDVYLTKKNHSVLLQKPGYVKLKNAIEIKEQCDDQKSASIHHTLYAKGLRVDHQPYEGIHTLTGCWAKKHTASEKLPLSINKPRNYFKQQTHRILNTLNIKAPIPLVATAYNTKKPATWHHQLVSEPLAKINTTMLDKSSNFIANQLAKRMSAISFGEPGTWELAEKSLLKTLSKYQISDQASLADGAGLSRNNRIQAKSLADALQDIFHTPKLRSLIDGLHCTTIISDNGDKVPFCFKSGTLNGVVGRAGYVFPPNKAVKTVVILLNGNKNIQATFEKQEKAILKAIIDGQY